MPLGLTLECVDTQMSTQTFTAGARTHLVAQDFDLPLIQHLALLERLNVPVEAHGRREERSECVGAALTRKSANKPTNVPT